MPDDAPAQFTYHRRVEFAETDMAGIAHFANFYRWMEEAEHAYFRDVGVKIMARNPPGFAPETHDGEDVVVGWPRVSAKCTFERPAYHEDELRVDFNVERIGVKSLTFAVEFWRGEDRLAHGRMKTACCVCRRDGSLRSVPIPESYLSVIHEADAGAADA